MSSTTERSYRHPLFIMAILPKVFGLQSFQLMFLPYSFFAIDWMNQDVLDSRKKSDSLISADCLHFESHMYLSQKEKEESKTKGIKWQSYHSSSTRLFLSNKYSGQGSQQQLLRKSNDVSAVRGQRCKLFKMVLPLKIVGGSLSLT